MESFCFLAMQVLQNEDTENPLKKVDPQLLKVALTPYPKLKAALFPPCTSRGILPPDISLYHLVQVHRMLFSSAFWQKKSKVREACFRLMPGGWRPHVVSLESFIWS